MHQGQVVELCSHASGFLRGRKHATKIADIVRGHGLSHKWGPCEAVKVLASL